MTSKNSWIVVNDVLEELSEENQRLLNELLLANKSVNLLTQFKSFIDLIAQKFITNLDSNELTSFDKLNEEISQFIKECEEFDNKRSEELNHNLITNDNNYVKQEIDSDSNISDDFGSDDKTKNIIDKPFKRQLVCNVCGKPYFSRIYFNKHLRSHQKNGNNKRSQNKTKDSVIKSMKTLTIRKRTRKPIKTAEELESHQKNDNNEEYHYSFSGGRWRRRRYRYCDYPGCQFKAMDKYNLDNHINTHTGNMPHECTHCGKAFPYNSALINHISYYHRLLDQPLVCDIDGCNKQFKTEVSFKDHQRSCHFAEKRFVCDHPGCDYRAAKKSKIIQHKISHSKDRPYVCTVEGCNKRFKSQSALNYHLELHVSSGERNFICTHEGCGKTFKSKNNLNAHIYGSHRKTPKEKRFHCDWPGCEFKHFSKARVSEHQTTHSDQRNYECLWPSCGKRFKQKQSLASHMRIHTNDKRYACEWPGCDYRCTTSGNLKIHKKVHQKGS